MKKVMLSFLLSFLTLFLTSLANAEDAYTIDPSHSYVLWHINHFDFSHPSGKWMITEGKIILDKKKPQNSHVNIMIHVANITTGVPELDEHLKGQLFFNVVKFPDATFVSDKVTLTGKDNAKVQGTLTVHGVSKPIILAVKLNKIGINPITNKETAGFTATTSIKRSDFGITTLLPGLGDQVTINIEAEAYKA